MEKVLKKVEDNKALSLTLRLFSHLVTALSMAVFAYLAIISAKSSIIMLSKLLVVLGVPFVAVSALRQILNAPRPYEIYDFYDTPPKKKCGKSFPSRHAFSAFAIGTAFCFVSPLLGEILLLLAALMSAARVLLGIHFTRDVMAGAIIGTVSTLLGKLIFSFV